MKWKYYGSFSIDKTKYPNIIDITQIVNSNEIYIISMTSGISCICPLQEGYFHSGFYQNENDYGDMFAQKMYNELHYYRTTLNGSRIDETIKIYYR